MSSCMITSMLVYDQILKLKSILFEIFLHSPYGQIKLFSGFKRSLCNINGVFAVVFTWILFCVTHTLTSIGEIHIVGKCL